MSLATIHADYSMQEHKLIYIFYNTLLGTEKVAGPTIDDRLPTTTVTTHYIIYSTQKPQAILRTKSSMADVQRDQTIDAVGDCLSFSSDPFSLPYCFTNVVLPPAPPDVNTDVSVPRAAAVPSGE